MLHVAFCKHTLLSMNFKEDAHSTLLLDSQVAILLAIAGYYSSDAQYSYYVMTEGNQGYAWTKITATLERPMAHTSWAAANLTDLTLNISNTVASSAPLLAFPLIKDKVAAFGGYSTSIVYRIQTSTSNPGLNWQLQDVMSRTFNQSTVVVSVDDDAINWHHFVW